MPIHDWTRVDAGLFHAFHHGWVCKLCSAINTGRLAEDYYALAERKLDGNTPDPKRSEADLYAEKANHVAIRHRHGHVVAVIEIVSPGNKGSRNGLREFVDKAVHLLRRQVHLLVIDLFPPGPRDPQGIHKAIWDEFEEEDFDVLPDKPLTLASYDAGPPVVAYVESVGVGDPLPELPLFLKPEIYVPAPLEATYQTTWRDFPGALKHLLERPPEQA